MILDESTRHIDVFNIDCNVEELLQVVSTTWEHLLPDGAIISLSYHGRCGSRNWSRGITYACTIVHSCKLRTQSMQ